MNGVLFRAGLEHMQPRHRVRDYLVYVGVGLAIVVVVVIIGIHDADRGIDREFKNDWTVLVTSAALVFGYAIKDFWRFRRAWRFWAAFSGLIGLHFVVLAPILTRMDKVPLLVVVPLAMVELVVVYPALSWAVSVFRRNP